MKNLVIILSLFLFSCKATKPFTAQPTHERITTITTQVHDTVLVVKADTSSIAAKLEVDDNGQIYIAKTKWPQAAAKNKMHTGRAVQPTVTIDAANIITVQCKCDSAAIRFGYTQTTTKDSTTITITTPPITIEKKISKWRWVQIWVGRVSIILMLTYLVLFILKKLKYI